jgi:hypothetical protein
MSKGEEFTKNKGLKYIIEEKGRQAYKCGKYILNVRSIKAVAIYTAKRMTYR